MGLVITMFSESTTFGIIISNTVSNEFLKEMKSSNMAGGETHILYLMNCKIWVSVHGSEYFAAEEIVCRIEITGVCVSTQIVFYRGTNEHNFGGLQ